MHLITKFILVITMSASMLSPVVAKEIPEFSGILHFSMYDLWGPIGALVGVIGIATGIYYGRH